jgi:hypothetical protein
MSDYARRIPQHTSWVLCAAMHLLGLQYQPLCVRHICGACIQIHTVQAASLERLNLDADLQCHPHRFCTFAQ